MNLKLGDKVKIIAEKSVFKGYLGLIVSIKSGRGLLVKFGKRELFFNPDELLKVGP
jgi:hypothetical protein